MTIAKQLLTQGVLGCVCLLQIIVIRKLYSDLSDAKEELTEALEDRADWLERELASKQRNKRCGPGESLD